MHLHHPLGVARVIFDALLPVRETNGYIKALLTRAVPNGRVKCALLMEYCNRRVFLANQVLKLEHGEEEREVCGHESQQTTYSCAHLFLPSQV